MGIKLHDSYVMFVMSFFAEKAAKYIQNSNYV